MFAPKTMIYFITFQTPKPYCLISTSLKLPCSVLHIYMVKTLVIFYVYYNSVVFGKKTRAIFMNLIRIDFLNLKCWYSDILLLFRTETEYVSQILSKIKRFAQHHMCHVWFIAHPKQVCRVQHSCFSVSQNETCVALSNLDFLSAEKLGR